jgi:hypothetical protein
MQGGGRKLIAGAVGAACLLHAGVAAAVPWEERSAAARAFYSGVAVIANVTPIVSAFFAPRCLPGYILCKASFSFVSLVAAADHLFLSGAGDEAQTRALLHRGFAGDWYLTGRHIAGDLTPQPLPDPPPPPTKEGEGWQPPPR